MTDEGLLNGAMEELEIIERNLVLINALERIQPAGIIRLAEHTDLPRHKVRYSLRLLESAGIVEATTEGAMLSADYTEYLRKLDVNLAAVAEKASAIRSRLPT